jgi:hypothetical protein
VWKVPSKAARSGSLDHDPHSGKQLPTMFSGTTRAAHRACTGMLRVSGKTQACVHKGGREAHHRTVHSRVAGKVVLGLPKPAGAHRISGQSSAPSSRANCNALSNWWRHAAHRRRAHSVNTVMTTAEHVYERLVTYPCRHLRPKAPERKGRRKQCTRLCGWL